MLSRLMTSISIAAATFAVAVPAARADVISISAAGFIQQNPCTSNTCNGALDHGAMVSSVASRYFAAIDFPVNGNKICSMSLFYQDTNANDAMVARLLRKSFAPGGDPFSDPAIVVSVSSAAGVIDAVRKTTVRPPAPPSINDNSGAYYLEVEVPTINLVVLGVQIDHRPTCP